MPTFFPNSGFMVSGQNTDFVDSILFGEIEVRDLDFIDNTGISGIVPTEMVSTDYVLVNTAMENINLGSGRVIWLAGNQVKVGELATGEVSGSAGDMMTLTGENFYNITDIKFGETECTDFRILDEDEIQVIIPEDADYGGITVFNSLNTGVDGDTSVVSGLTVNQFVPIPSVTGLSSGTLVSGEVLSILGNSLSGVTGVTMNTLPTTSFATVSSTQIDVTVPTGNTRGAPRLLMKSGQYYDVDPLYSFTPQVTVSRVARQDGTIVAGPGAVGIGSTAGNLTGIATGNACIISGGNFSSDLLYETGGGYLVGIGGETGVFSIISPEKISGFVPTGIPITITGESYPTLGYLDIDVYSNNYPESYNADVRFPPAVASPSVSSYSQSLNTLPWGNTPNDFSSGTAQGISGDTLTVFGENFYGITGVFFHPASQGNLGVGDAVLSGVSEATDGRSITLTIPNVTGLYGSWGEFYNIIYSGRFGEYTGISSFYNLGSPRIDNTLFTAGESKGILPNENVGPGETGRLKGRNFYSGTEVLLYDTNFEDDNFIMALPTSGYGTGPAWTSLQYTYPDSFNTGINYKITARNRYSLATGNPSYNDWELNVIPKPIISGFRVNPTTRMYTGGTFNYADFPLSGTPGMLIAISGEFTQKTGVHFLAGPNAGPVYTDSAIGDSTGIEAWALSAIDMSYPGFLNSGQVTPFYRLGIPPGTQSDVISIYTDGGVASTSGILGVYPRAPEVSGFWYGTGSAPFNTGSDTDWDKQRYLGPGSFVNVSGARMNLVTGIEFSGSNDSFSINRFTRKDSTRLQFNLPAGINTGSGIFQVVDYVGRKDSSRQLKRIGFPKRFSTVETGIDFSIFSGVTDYVMPGQDVSLSGWNTPATRLAFPTISGGDSALVTVHGGSFFGDFATYTYKLPTGITYDPFVAQYYDLVSGIVVNSNLFNEGVSSTPLPKISWVDPYPSSLSSVNSLTGDIFKITGYNSYYDEVEGDLVVGITGTGNKNSEAQVYFYGVSGYETGLNSADSNAFYNGLEFQLDSGFIGTGQFFLVNPWEDFTGDIKANFIGSVGEELLHRNLDGTTAQRHNTNQIFPYDYIISGTRVDVTGYGPVRGITGSNVELTGAGLDPVTGVYFKVHNGPYLEADYTLNSSTSMTVEVPQEGVEVRGFADIILSGGTNETLPNFEVLLDATAVQFNTLREDEEPGTSSGTSQYVIEETLDGVVYLVTKTKFPDGTTTLVSSVPKG